MDYIGDITERSGTWEQERMKVDDKVNPRGPILIRDDEMIAESRPRGNDDN